MANGGWPDATGMFELIPALDLLTTEYVPEDVDLDYSETETDGDDYAYDEEEY